MVKVIVNVYVTVGVSEGFPAWTVCRGVWKLGPVGLAEQAKPMTKAVRPKPDKTSRRRTFFMEDFFLVMVLYSNPTEVPT